MSKSPMFNNIESPAYFSSFQKNINFLTNKERSVIVLLVRLCHHYNGWQISIYCKHNKFFHKTNIFLKKNQYLHTKKKPFLTISNVRLGGTLLSTKKVREYFKSICCFFNKVLTTSDFTTCLHPLFYLKLVGMVGFEPTFITVNTYSFPLISLIY